MPLVGVTTSDARRMGIVLDTDEMAAALDALRYPNKLVLAEGFGPVLPELTYVLPVVMAALAVVARLCLVGES